MELQVDGIGRLVGTPEEFARLLASGRFSLIAPSEDPERGACARSGGVARQAGSFVGRESQETSSVDEALDAQPGAPMIQPGSVVAIDSDLFFRAISRSMARIMLVFLGHGGRVEQSRLLTETGLTGTALRRPNGALNQRIRDASLGRLQEFYSVKLGSNNTRLFEVSVEILQFLRTHEARIRSLAGEALPAHGHY